MYQSVSSSSFNPLHALKLHVLQSGSVGKHSQSPVINPLSICWHNKVNNPIIWWQVMTSDGKKLSSWDEESGEQDVLSFS